MGSTYHHLPCTTLTSVGPRWSTGSPGHTDRALRDDWLVWARGPAGDCVSCSLSRRREVTGSETLRRQKLRGTVPTEGWGGCMQGCDPVHCCGPTSNQMPSGSSFRLGEANLCLEVGCEE